MSLSARREVLSNQSKLQSVVRQQAESQPANVWAMVPGRSVIDFPVTAGNGQMQAISRSAARGQQATTAGLLLHLQRTHGNRYIQRALALSRQEDGEPGVAPGVESAIDRSRGGGQALDKGVRTQMESAFGADFGAVRIHTGSEAHALNRAVSAIAFTIGPDVFFRDGAYSPASAGGRELLAHELTHVVQQGGAAPIAGQAQQPTQRLCAGCEDEKASRVQAKLTVSQPDDQHEREAEQVGKSVAGMLGESAAQAPAPVARSVQRRAVMVQRAPHPPEPLGGIQVVFDPKATLTLDAPVGSTTTQDIGSSDQTIFSGVQRGVSGSLVFPVTETWGPAPPPPGPVPTNPCDFCEILRNLGTVNIPVFGKIQVIPDVIIQECKALGITNIKDFLAFLNDLERRVQDPCSFVDTSSWPVVLSVPFNLACATFSSVPPVSTIKGALQGVLKSVRNAVLNNIPPQCKDPNRVVPNQNSGSGQAISTLRMQFIPLAGGALQLVGPPPQAITNGTGAELVVPVDFSESSVPDGAIITIQPLIRSTVLHNSGNLSTPETHGVSHPFTVRIQVQAPPSPKPYDCTESFGPFVIASDRFIQEDAARQKIHDWYFGLEPHVRQDLEQGIGLLRVTGRASSTGSKTFNLSLAEKRARKVRGIIADFAGSDAHLRTFALGEFGAQTADNTEDPNERRVDVEASGQVPGEQAGAMQGDTCAGHLGEVTPTGPTGPVTTPAGVSQGTGLAPAGGGQGGAAAGQAAPSPGGSQDFDQTRAGLSNALASAQEELAGETFADFQPAGTAGAGSAPGQTEREEA